MERSTAAFWTLVLVLFGAAGFYATEVLRFQSQQRAQDLVLASGDVVTLKTVLEGDTLVVARGADGVVTVRLLGVRAFSSRGTRDGLAVAARAAALPGGSSSSGSGSEEGPGPGPGPAGRRPPRGRWRARPARIRPSPSCR